jgi:methyl-accepting chemotaxis protein
MSENGKNDSGSETEQPGNHSKRRKQRTKIKQEVTSEMQSSKGESSQQLASDSKSSNKNERTSVVYDEQEPVSTIDSYNPEQAKRALRRYFMATLIVGSGLILVAPFDGLAQIILSVALMFVYLFIGKKYMRNASTQAVFADSVYYLGFLFTFIALVAAMITIDGGNFNIEKIIGQMGPALITTVVGMAARIYLTQFEPITSEPETEVLNTVGELSSKLITALQHINENAVENEKTLKQLRQNTEAQMVAFVEKLQEINFSSVTLQVSELTGAIETLKTSGEELSKSANRTKIAVEDSAANLSNLDTSIADVKKKLEQAEDFSSDLDDLNKNINEANKGMKSVTESVSREVGKVFERLEQETDTAVNQVGKVAEITVDKIQKTSDAIESQTQDTANKIEKSLSSVVSQIKKTEVEAKDINSNMKKMISDVLDFFNRQK